MKPEKTIHALATGVLATVASLSAAPVLSQDHVCMETNVGEFCMELLWDDAPITVANFLNYVESGRFDNTLIHRSEPLFVIQGGGFYLEDLSIVPEDPQIQNEPGVSNSRGTVAMAKLGGQANSASSQWYINLQNNGGEPAHLDISNGGYTVFARIISGMDVVDAIGAYQVVNLSQYGADFASVPVQRLPDDLVIELEDLIEVKRVYSTMLEPPAPPALNEYSDGVVHLLAEIDGLLYRGKLQQVRSFPDFVFTVDLGQLQLEPDTGQERAIFDGSDGTLRVNAISAGNLSLSNLVLQLTDQAKLELTLVSYEVQ